MINRREFLHGTACGAGCALFAYEASAVTPDRRTLEARFPHFQSTPVSYMNVTMQDAFWAPRQRTIRDVTLPWATRHFDDAGGLDVLKQSPASYVARTRAGDLESIKFIEALASAAGVQRDAAVEKLIDAWGKRLIDGQGPDGYSAFGYPMGADPARRWQALWISHEDYALGHYLESAIAYRDVTGNEAMYESAVRAVDNMASVFLGSDRAYAPGHQEIEQALMRLYGLTGDKKYLQLCGWLIDQRGRANGRRPSFGRYSQDHVPVRDQRTIEGHAVRAGFLFNGVTEYVGATGDKALQEAVLAIWSDLIEHKMYVHGASGNVSAKNEGYRSKPDYIPPDDTYGESCSVFANFQWAHSLFRLTGDARYLDAAERMLYNAFYASLSLRGDSYFYRNVAQVENPTPRHEWHGVPCCPPNIVKLFCKVGGFFYSTDSQGIFVKHYGASAAEIPFGSGVKLIQRTEYPWHGAVTLQVEPKRRASFALRLRVPEWARSHTLSVNGTKLDAPLERGWLVVQRKWQKGDLVELSLPMEIERVTMPPRFKEYADLVALKRGPIVYCLEGQDMPALEFNTWAYCSPDSGLTSEHRADLLGGVTVLRGELRQVNVLDGTEKALPAMWVPYGVWNNRTPGVMRIWMPSRKISLETIPAPADVDAASC